MPVRRPLLLLVFLLSFSAAALPQIPGLTPPQPAAARQVPAVPPDPLGRETPRGTLLGFIKAAQEEQYAKAVEYFQPPSRRRRSEQDDEELAAQLLTIFNQKFTGALELTSTDPLGHLDDGLPPDQEKITGALGTADKFPIQMVRLEDEYGRKLWYFARSTLDHVPGMYDSLTFPEIEKQIPQTLVTHRFLFMPLWQWIAIAVFLPVALLGGRLITMLFAFVVNRSRKARNKPPLAPQKILSGGPDHADDRDRVALHLRRLHRHFAALPALLPPAGLDFSGVRFLLDPHSHHASHLRAHRRELDEARDAGRALHRLAHPALYRSFHFSAGDPCWCCATWAWMCPPLSPV